MKQFLRDLFVDSSGVSMMRLLCLLCVLTGCVIALYETKNGTDNIGIISVLIGTGITGKVGQKWIESSNDSNQK